MSRNFTCLDELHEKFTAAGIEHHYYGAAVITVTRGDHAWTVSENLILYWGDDIDVCKTRYLEFGWVADAFDYIMDVYSKAQ